MTTQHLKKEVVKALDEVPDDILVELLDYLRSLQGKDEVSIQRVRHIRSILMTDSALLKALAE